MATGVIKFYHQERGYGYIAPDDGSKDAYFEHSQFKRSDQHIAEGLRVEYKMKLTPKGPQACDIEVLS